VRCARRDKYASSRDAAHGTLATAQIELFFEEISQGSIATYGTYTLADKTLKVKVDHSTFPNWNGAEQTRTIVVTGDEMKWSNPAGSAGGVAEKNLRAIGTFHRCNHSITSSARCWRIQGTSRPRALAVLRLTISSNFVGA
jgi:hypothetical protein